MRIRLGRVNSDAYKSGLDSLAGKFTDKDCQLEIDLARLQWMESTQYSYPEEAQRDSARQAIYEFCRSNIGKYDGDIRRCILSLL